MWERGGEGLPDGEKSEKDGGGVHLVLELVLVMLGNLEVKEVRIEGLERGEGVGLVMIYYA